MTIRKTSEEFEDRLISPLCFHDIDWTRAGNCQECVSSSDMVRDYAKKFRLGHWSFLGLGEEEIVWLTFCKLEGQCFPLLMSWSPISKTADIQSSELPVRWIGDS